MLINTDTIFSMTQANQNFSAVARAADRAGEAVVFKNNHPKYLVVNLENSDYLLDLTEDEKIDIVTKRVLNKKIDVHAMISFLERNRIHIEASDGDVVALGLGTAEGSMEQEDVLAWIRQHRTVI